MVQWRQLGVVPDSDDEGALSDVQLSSDGKRSVEGPVPEDENCLSNSLTEIDPPTANDSLLTIRQSLLEDDGDNAIHTGTYPEFTASSGLSDVPSSPLSDVQEDLTYGQSSSQPQGPIFANVESTPPEDQINSDPDETSGFSPTFSRIDYLNNGRALRRRNPIQLHPYLLENEIYRQALRGRGVRPVTLAEPAGHHHHSQPETQNQYTPDELHESHYDRIGSSQELFRSSSDGNLPDSMVHANRVSTRDDLPTLAELLRNDGFGNESGSRKRLKISQPEPIGLNRMMNNTWTSPIPSPTTPSGNNFLFTSEAAQLSGKNGPRKSFFSKQRKRWRKFRMPKEVDQNALPTPQPSSDARENGTPVVTIESASGFDPDSEVHPSPRASTPGNLDIENPSLQQGDVTIASITRLRSHSPPHEPSSASDSEQIHTVTKRIKGVLPASWLRLDQQVKHRQKPDSRSERLKAQVAKLNPENQKGVAKRIRPTTGNRMQSQHSSANNRLHILQVLNDSDTASNDSSQSIYGQDRILNEPQNELDNGIDTQDVDEEDWIDPMLPGTSRPRSKRKDHKRQIRLSDAFSRGERSHRRIEKYHSHQTKASAHDSYEPEPAHIRRKPRRKPEPQFGIVDAARSTSRRVMPDFIRVALRQATSRTDKGRHGPSKKSISMHTNEDNVELNEVLKCWENGFVEQLTGLGDELHDPVSHHRTPLQSRSHNPQHRPRSPGNVRKASAGNRRAKTTESAPTKLRKLVPQNFLGSMNAEIQKPPGSESNLESSFSRIQGQNARSPKHSEFQRPGQLETTQTLDSFLHDRAGLPQRAARDFVSARTTQPRPRTLSNPLLDRFLMDESHAVPSESETNSGTTPRKSDEKITTKPSKSNKQRKRVPRPLAAGSTEFLRLQSPEVQLDECYTNDTAKKDQLADYLSGLGPYGTRYPSDFGIKPLPVGVFFRTTTLLGSGQFRKALDIRQRNLDQDTAPTTIYNGVNEYKLGKWTSETSDSLERVYSTVLQLLEQSQDLRIEKADTAITKIVSAQASISLALTSTIEYLSAGLSFADSVDRPLFVSRTSESLERLLEHYNYVETTLATNEVNAAIIRLRIKTLTLLNVISFVNSQISIHNTVSPQFQEKANEVCRKCCSKLMNSLAGGGINAIRDTAKQAQHPEWIEFELNEQHVEVESVVILFHVMEKAFSGSLTFFELFSSSFPGQKIEAFTTVPDFEQVWSAAFALLPYQEIDSTGVMKPGRRAPHSDKDWTFIKQLTDRVLKLYSSSANHHTATANSYVRALLCRILILIERCGWHRCENILGLLFDFFARRNLKSLLGEDHRYHPNFLQELDRGISGGFQSGDRSFDVFLKILAAGLRNLSLLLPPRKLHNLAWRFLPNHGRNHSKENDLQESDLDALKNHHNLLCVLYCASPAGYRISLDMVQNLVDFSTSHSEVCRLNVRTWANLLRFQLSTDEGPQSMSPFVSWLDLMLEKSLIQHEQARSEAEAMFHEANNDLAITHDLLESTIASNEKQVEDTLINVLGLASSVLKNAENIEMASTIVEDSSLSNLILGFSPSKSRFSRVIKVALDVYLTYFGLLDGQLAPTSTQAAEQDNNDDSQDYGEWLALEEMDETDPQSNGRKNVSTTVTETLQHLLSNCFGAEEFYEETLLAKIVDAWVTQCNLQVRLSGQEWGQYLDRQGSGSWYSLRDTTQTRQFACYFYAAVLSKDPGAFDTLPFSFLSTWLVSLVDRESILKFQHMLANELLNARTEHPLLYNLPFWRNRTIQQYNISLTDIRERRLGLLSTLFSNVRKITETKELASEMRYEYVALLKELMNAMRRNYEHVQNRGSNTSDSYVEFVQRVIELLQQYTSDICPIHKFFTDQTTFPLPVSDPQYVVGRLKSYGLKLCDRSTQKQLVIFLQSVCERAAIDGQQDYLISQLVKCQSNIQERAQDRQPTLRNFLVQTLFPQYIALVHSFDSGWILAVPILEALGDIMDDLIFHFSVSDQASSDLVVQMCSGVLYSLRSAFCATPPEMSLRRPASVHTLSAILHCATSTLSVVDYLHRSWNNGDAAIQEIINLYEAGNLMGQAIQSGSEGTAWPTILNSPQSSTSEIQSFCARELQTSLSQRWHCESGLYYVWQGNSRKKVPVELATLEEEQRGLLEAIDDLRMTMARLPVFAARIPSDHGIEARSISALGTGSVVASNV